MNKFSFQTTNDNDFSIVLLVDGKIIDGFEQADNKAIPYWLFEISDLPKWCPYPHNKDVTILGVCSCGEVGCGSAGCIVVKKKKEVIFKEIFIDGFDVTHCSCMHLF